MYAQWSQVAAAAEGLNLILGYWRKSYTVCEPSPSIGGDWRHEIIIFTVNSGNGICPKQPSAQCSMLIDGECRGPCLWPFSYWGGIAHLVRVARRTRTPCTRNKLVL